MRQLPYAKQLLEARRAGRRPWLVMVIVGDNAKWRPLLRKMIAADEDGTAWLWWPADLAPADADVSLLLGLDVMVAGADAPEALLSEVATAIWSRARPSTVWMLRQPDRNHLHLSPNWAKFRAARVVPSGLRRAPLVLNGIGVPIDAGLRRHIENARATALLCRDEPLFNQPQFDQVAAA